MTAEDKKPRCPKHDTGNGPCYCHLKKVNVGIPGHIDHGKPAEDSTENMPDKLHLDLHNAIAHGMAMTTADKDDISDSIENIMPIFQAELDRRVANKEMEINRLELIAEEIECAQNVRIYI